MSVRLTDDEAWRRIAASHTGIFTTLRRDGRPVALPIWFVEQNHRLYLGTPSRTKKVARIRHDDRGSFLVESGRRWAELAAVHLPVRAVVLDTAGHQDEIEGAARLFSAKYEAFRTPSTRMPTATASHYRSQVWIRLEPDGPMLTWDNARIRLRDAEPHNRAGDESP